MEHVQEVIQFLQRNPKSRAFQIIAGVRFHRREVFKALAVLRKRGQIKREGFHPKIYYSSLVSPQQQAKEKAPVKPPESKAASRGQSSPGAQGDQDALREEIARLKKELYNTENLLNRKTQDLKSALARNDYLEEVIATLKKRAAEYARDDKRMQKRG